MTKVTVTRFKAKDGSLHEKEEDQLSKDIEIAQEGISKIVKQLATTMEAQAPYSDDRGYRAVVEDDYEELIGTLIADHEEDIRKVFILRHEIGKLLHEKLMKLTAGDRDPDPVD